MATTEEHLEHFRHNVSVSRTLEASGNFDWAVTVLFYATLHLIQAYMVRHGLVADSHQKRERQMLADDHLRPVANAYKTLRDQSESARYECRRFSREEFESIRMGSFATVANHLRSLLGVSS